MSLVRLTISKFIQDQFHKNYHFTAPSGSNSDVDDSFAYQTHQIYSQRKLSDHFHKFSEVCMERWGSRCMSIVLAAIYFCFFIIICRFPDDRPTVNELQCHPFFKQCKHTSLAENFSLTDIDKYNCTKLEAGEFNSSGSCELCNLTNSFNSLFFRQGSGADLWNGRHEHRQRHFWMGFLTNTSSVRW